MNTALTFVALLKILNSQVEMGFKIEIQNTIVYLYIKYCSSVVIDSFKTKYIITIILGTFCYDIQAHQMSNL